jgi:hypothetical protein
MHEFTENEEGSGAPAIADAPVVAVADAAVAALRPPRTEGERADRIEAREVYDWLSRVGSTGEIKAELYRHQPLSYRGVKTNGLCDTYAEPVDIQRIQETHGGGKYLLRCQQRVRGKTGAGKWAYAGAASFDVAGPPKLDSLRFDEPDHPRGNGADMTGPVQQAMNLSYQMVKDANARAERLETDDRRGVGTDPAIVTLIEGLNRQVASLQSLLSDKDDRLVTAMSAKPDTSATDRVIGLMEKQTVSESNRLDAIRQAHDSELRQLREFNRNEISARETRFEREIDALRQAHIREIDSLKGAHTMSLETLKQSYASRIDALKETIGRLERELAETRTELGQVRGRKELSPIDQIQGLVALKNGFEALSPTDKDDEPGSTAERVITAIFDSPVAQGIASRIAQSAPPNQEMVWVKRQDGQMVQVPRAYLTQLQQQRQMQAQAGAAEGGKDAAPTLDKAEVKRAVQFLETAYKNGHAPQVVAASARNLIPGKILSFLKKKGVDAFLNEVADLEDGSSLATVAGRIYIRNVAKFLLEGAVDEAPEAPSDAAADEVDEPDDAAVQ